jgi:hypothetical protein
MEMSSSLAGVLASSPLILQAKPASKVARWAGGHASKIAPNATIKAEVKADVCYPTFPRGPMLHPTQIHTGPDP